MAAIAYSLVGLAAREENSQETVRGFAGKVGKSARHIYRMADTYALWLKFEDEGYSQVEPLTQTLDFKHFTVAAQEVLNRSETNADACAAWLERAAGVLPHCRGHLFI